MVEALVHLMVEGQGVPPGAGALRLATAVVIGGKWHARVASLVGPFVGLIQQDIRLSPFLCGFLKGPSVA